MMKAIKFFFVATIILSSCATPNRCARKFPAQVTDTFVKIVKVNTNTITKIKDTVLKFQTVTDTIKITDIKNLPLNKWISKRGKDNEVRTKRINDSTIVIDCSSMDRIIEGLHKEITILKNSTTDTKKQITPAPIKYIPNWVYKVLLAFVIQTILILVWLYFKFIK